MKRFAVLGSGIILLGVCALPVPFQVASWALDGISYLMTDKSVADHGISALAQKDCALLRGLMNPDEFCRDFDDTATTLADGGDYSLLFSSGTDDTIDEDFGALSDFGTASGDTGGDTTEIADVAAAAAGISADVALKDGASLDAYPGEITVAAPVVVAAAAETGKSALPVVEMKTGKDWQAGSTEVVETGKEPTAGYYFVIGSFRKYANAKKLRHRYRSLTPSVLSAKLNKTTVYRVVVGPFDRDKAKGAHRRIFKAGISDSWAIRVKPGEWSMAMIDPPAVAPVEVVVLGRMAVVDEIADSGAWSAATYFQSLAERVVD